MESAVLREQYQALRDIAAGAWHNGAPAGMRRVRDLTLLPLIGDVMLVVACDSNASIGEKPNDKMKISYEEQGISVLKVALMEVLAAGATPVLIVNALCVEMEPSGRRVIESMRAELARCGFDPDLALTGSTEDNVETTQSGFGITVIGLVTEDRFRPGRTEASDIVLCVGTPKGGFDNPYTEYDDDIASIQTMLTLTSVDGIHEILPVGSKGVRYEAHELARCAGCEFRVTDETLPIDLNASAGTSTAVLVSLPAEYANHVREAVDVPVYRIGMIV